MREFKETPIGSIPSDWDIKTLDEIKSPEKKSIISGPFGSNISAKYFVSFGVPVIRGNNLSLELGVRFKDNGFVFITEEKANELGTWAIEEDIIFTAVGTIGQIGIIERNTKYKKYIISNKQLRIRVNKSLIEPLFAYYWIASPQMVETIEQRNTGSSVPLINLSVLKSLLIPIPSKSEREQITELLSSLDDKIDLLHRQNKTLEQLAETLFRQWFVEEAEESWEVGKVEDLFLLQRGFDLPAQDRTKGIYPIIASNGINGYHDEFKIKGPGVTTGRSGVLGKVIYTQEDFWPLNTTLFIKEYKIATPLFAYFFLKTLDLETLNGGSAVPTLNRNHVHEMATIIPSHRAVIEFEEIVAVNFQKIKSNTQQICTLTQLRDTLLPKLMSGEVRVNN